MKMERKRQVVQAVVRVYLVIQFLIGGCVWLFAQDANEVLQKAASAFDASSGIEARFALHSRSPQTQSGESFEGIIYMKGDKFKLQTPDMITWYDGTTQWTYMERTQEVNVSTPGSDELQQTNPAALIHNYEKGFKASLKGSSTTRQGKAAYDVELLPKKKSDVESVVLQIEKNSYSPASIDIRSDNGMRHTIVISTWKTAEDKPDSFFVFDEAEFPDAEIIDLR